MEVVAGQPFTATLVDPGGLSDLNLGARIEVPVTRAIVTAWTAAVLQGNTWSVTLDAPPAEPPSQVYYALGAWPVIQAELDAGEFNIVWMDDVEPPTVEIYVPLWTSTEYVDPNALPVPEDWTAPDLTQVTPTLADVAALESTRTIDDTATELGTFTADTRPTDTQVTGLIAQATHDVLASLRPTFPASYYPIVRNAIALYTAILIEGSFYREQLNEGSAQLYRQLFTAEIAGLQSATTVDLTDQLVGRLH
jgi:hypothetical protein